MPRVARKISNTKVYHIILRGNDRQDIFYDEKMISRELILSMFGQTKKEAIENFIIFHSYEEKNINEEVEYEIIDKLTDEQVKRKIQKILSIEDVWEIRTYNKKVRDEKIYQLKNIKGTSKTQLSRILGINRKVIERVMKN